MKIVSRIAKVLLDSLFIKSTETRRSILAGARSFLSRRDLLTRRQSVPSSCDLEIPVHRGYAFVGPDVFQETAQVCTDALELVNQGDIFTARTNNKPQLLTGLLDRETVSHTSPLMTFALNDTIIGAVARYLDCVPLLTHLDVWYSQSTPKLSDSQLFHCDWAAISQVKVFILATQVQADGGPLTVIDAATSKGIRTKLRYEYGQRLSDEQVNEFVSPCDYFQVVGPSGSVALVDTSKCFHFGSRVGSQSSARVVAILQYMKPTDFAMIGKQSPFRHICRPEMSQIQQLVLGGNYASWRPGAR